MAFYIFLFAYFVIILASFSSARMGEKPNKNTILGIALPLAEMNNEEVQKVVKSYHKSNILLLIIFILIAIPSLFFAKLVAITMIYFSVVITCQFVGSNCIFRSHLKQLYALKVKNGWFVGETHVPTITEKAGFFGIKRKLSPAVLAKAPPLVDDDEYWQHGYYYNPFNKKRTVEKRVGIGEEVNMATSLGKIIHIFCLLAVALVAGLAIIFLPLDFGEIDVTFNGNVASVSAPLYGTSFDKTEIESVSMQDDTPHISKTDGISTSKYLIGNYYASGIGKCKMYLYRDVKNYLVITFKDDSIVCLNGKNVETTEKLYGQLTSS